MRKTLLLIILSIYTNVLKAQTQTPGPEMADKLRADGKIYIVVLVLATIFAGIIAYLIRLELKINKLEKNKPS